MGNDMDEEIKYYLIACGTKDYNAFEQLPSVETDLELVNSLFTSGFGYERVLPSLHLNPTTNDLKTHIPHFTLKYKKLQVFSKKKNQNNQKKILNQSDVEEKS